MDMNDDMYKNSGFEDSAEFHSMVASIDLQTQFKAFLRWQEEDGTKSGLINVINGKEYDAI